jgi:predicted Abi (CAAX) family protease
VRVVAAFTTIPGPRAWGRCALAFGIFLICALPFGVLTGLLRPSTPHTTAAQLLGAALMVLVHPALVEEFIFRVLLLPRDLKAVPPGRALAMAAFALATYVASHPISAMLFRPQALHVFSSPAYLTLAALLGATCTAAYWISRSIWPPVLIHWLSVVLWLWFLGGQALLC